MNFFADIFKKKTVSALGIDIGSSSIKVVQLKKDGEKAVLETYGELSLGPYGGVSIGQSTNLGTDKIVQAVGEKQNPTDRLDGLPMRMFRLVLETVLVFPAQELFKNERNADPGQNPERMGKMVRWVRKNIGQEMKNRIAEKSPGGEAY